MKKLLVLFLSIVVYGGISIAQDTTGLVAYYPFNGNANDESGNNRHGTAYGNPLLTTDRFGKPDSAYFFDGSDDYIDCGDWFTYNIFSLSFWVNQSGFTGNYIDIIDNNHTDNQNWVIQSNPNDTLYEFGVKVNQLDTFFLTFNRWFYVVCIKDSLNMKVYVNGILIQNLPAVYLMPYNNQHLFISKWGGYSGRHFYGKIDDIRMYDRALNEQEIQQLYHEGGWLAVPSYSNNNFNIEIYPNPTHEKVYIKSEKTIQIKVYNFLGEQIFTGNSNECNYVTLVQKGIYLFELSSENNTVYKKVVVQ